MYKAEYLSIWRCYGEKIIKTFYKITNLPFIEDKIIGIVGEGDANKDNNAGKNINKPMLFRYNIRNKLGTILHELSHRLIMEHAIFEKSKKKFNFTDEHQIIDLFLFDVMEDMFGKKAALFRVEYEKGFFDPKYSRCWNEAINLTKKERFIKLSKIINYCQK
jgi:hypothetical protein